MIGRQTIVESECLTIGSHSNGTSGEHHHSHLLTTGTSTLQQIGLIVENAVHDDIDIRLIASLHNHVQFLTHGFINQLGLLEERHFGFQLREADTRANGCVYIVCRSLEDYWSTIRALDPGQAKTELLVCRKQFLTDERWTVLQVVVPENSHFLSGYKIKNIHVVIFLLSLKLLQEQNVTLECSLYSVVNHSYDSGIQSIQIYTSLDHKGCIRITIGDINVTVCNTDCI